jgi:hypothetical protein
MDYARDIDGVILRVITTTRTTISASSTAIGFASHDCWGPQKLYITVGTTGTFLLRTSFLLLLHFLDWLVIAMHSPIPTKDILKPTLLGLSIS